MARPRAQAATREEIAQRLAEWHFLAEPELTKILWARRGEGQPLRFVEVLAGQQVSGRPIEVFAFDATRDVPYASEIAMISETELKLVNAGVLTLPDGWSLEDATAFERPARQAAAR